MSGGPPRCGRAGVGVVAAAIVWMAATMGIGARAQGATVPVAAQQAAARPDWTPMLPPGPGRDYAIGLCNGCHSVARLALQKRSATGWRSFLVGLNTTVTTGGEICACVGGPLDDEEIETLMTYLAAAFGPANPIDQLPLNLNTASAAALARLPGLSAADVEKLIEARSRRPFVSRRDIEHMVGRVKFQRIGTFVDVKDSLYSLELSVPR